MHAWQIYVRLFSAFLVFSALGRVFLYWKRRDAVSPLDLFEGLVGLSVIPALFGFAYQRPYGPHPLWMILCVLLGLLSVYQFFTPKMKKLYGKGWLLSAGVIGLQTALGGPALWALMRYAFLEPALWS